MNDAAHTSLYTVIIKWKTVQPAIKRKIQLNYNRHDHILYEWCNIHNMRIQIMFFF